MRRQVTWSVLILVCVCLGAALAPRPVYADDEAGWLLGQINALRASRGLPPYSPNAALAAAAAGHSAYLANNPWVDAHREANGSTPRSRIAAAGYGGGNIGENVYGGSLANAQVAFNWWLNSPIHLQGILNPNFTEIGIGIASGPYGHFYTTDFGGGAGAAPANPAPQPVQNVPTGGQPAAGGGSNGAPPPTARPIRRLPTAIPSNTPLPDQPPTATFTPIPSRTPTPLPRPEDPTSTPFIFDLTPQTGAYIDIQTTSVPASAALPAPSATPVRVAVVASPALSSAPGATPTAISPVATPAPAQSDAAGTAGDPPDPLGSVVRALLPVAIGVQVLLLAGIVVRRLRS